MTAPTSTLPTPAEAQDELEKARAVLEELETRLRGGDPDVGFEAFTNARSQVDWLEKRLEGAEVAARRQAVEDRDERAKAVRIKTRRALKRRGDKVLAAKSEVEKAIAALVKATEAYNGEAQKIGAYAVELRLEDESLDAPLPESVESVVKVAPFVPVAACPPSVVVQKTVLDGIRALDKDTDRISGTQLVALARTLDAPQVGSPWRQFMAIYESVSSDGGK